MSHTFRKSQIALASFGAFIAILPLSYVALNTESLMLLGSFGASALLLFALPEAPLSQPRSVICGHLIASAVALACLLLLGKTWWAVGAATGLGVGLMMMTHTIHPPAGSNAIIVFLASPTWDFLMLSTLSGTVLLVSVAYCYHKTTRRHRYPLYWISQRAQPALPPVSEEPHSPHDFTISDARHRQPPEATALRLRSPYKPARIRTEPIPIGAPHPQKSESHLQPTQQHAVSRTEPAYSAAVKSA